MTMRERLAAGLPPPDPVTVTERFFEDTASHLTTTRGQKMAAKTAPPKKPKWKPERMTCAVDECKRPFLPRNPHQMTCGNPWCQKKYKRRSQRTYRNNYYERLRKEASA